MDEEDVTRRGVKVPKGTRDINPYQAAVREQVIGKVTTIFKKHGAVTIETPVFELKDTLTGKYGEDSKLIYDLADQGGEICSLRYDLTVPFARYVAMNKLERMKRYHIAKVYRRDNPAMNRGRFREFYQCDFDIAGQYDQMMPDAECCKMMVEIFEALDIGNYTIKLNHRKLLDGIFEICNVPLDKFRPICSAVDKLDKETWETVRKEMVETKGLDEASADKIGEFVKIKGDPWQVLEKLRNEKLCEGSQSALAALDDLDKLFSVLKVFNIKSPQITFDLSLARGLDYYTGLIYETVLTDPNNMGSIAGGGRYDDLVGMYGKKPVPCVGFSIGIERIFTILEENARRRGAIRESSTDVMVVSVGADMTAHRWKLLDDLWTAGIAAEMLFKKDPKPKPQLDYANEKEIPFACFIGGDEIEKGLVKVKEMATGTQTDVARSELIAFLKSRIAAAQEALAAKLALPLPPLPTTHAVAASPEEIAAIEAEVKQQGDVIRDLKAQKADKAAIQTEVNKLLALKTKLKELGVVDVAEEKKESKDDKQSARGDRKAKDEKEKSKEKEKGQEKAPKEEKKEKPKEEKKDEKKEKKADESSSSSGFDDKLVKAVQKEGGKKGQDIIGAHEMGGLEFFCTSVDIPDGNLELVNICLDAMNVETDPTAEERRGGAAEVGKMIFSAGVDQLALVARIPNEKTSRLNVADWMQTVVQGLGGHIVGQADAAYAQAVVPADQAKGRFPIKMKDEAIAAAVKYLQEKGCFPQDNGHDSDSDVCYGDDAFDGFE
eukprot:c7922_g1_i1.p1 GENE.c7922_g1_i1~~c7922_g1_i1.p1  ORF type:complete len:790 (+),score=239.34 c7922_g1_i1:42-2372(+)